MKTSMQLKALIRNLSKEKGIEAEVLLRNYMLERLLERISLSPYQDRFILKGGMLIAATVGIEMRSTMDMDATIKNISLTEASLTEMLNVILESKIYDGVTMTLKGLETIRDESEYPGIRVSIEAILDKTKQTIKVDFTSGDQITPRAITYAFKLMFEDRTTNIQAYNLETILSEKLETILTRGTANTRMRDYYDIYILTTLRVHDINWSIFETAFKRTASARDSLSKIQTGGDKIITDINNSSALKALWHRYQNKNSYASGISWDQALSSVNSLYHSIKTL